MDHARGDDNTKKNKEFSCRRFEGEKEHFFEGTFEGLIKVFVFATAVYHGGKPGETKENRDGVVERSVVGRGRRCGCNYEGDSRGAGGIHFAN